MSESVALLDDESLRLRRLVLRALAAADKGHISSALSLIEIFRVLYRNIVKHDPKRPTWELRDRVILSKGHGGLALYAILADHGYFPLDLLDTYCKRNTTLGGHPERCLEIGIEASTGALGHGLPFAVGISIAHKRRRSGVRTFVVVGDGELNEGSNWEAMLIASKYQLSNLTIIVDNNEDQISGPIATVLPLEPLRQKLESFGAAVVETNGHDINSLTATFKSLPGLIPAGPRAVICKTIKGKGLAAAERNPMWHYKRAIGAAVIDEISAEWSTPQSA